MKFNQIITNLQDWNTKIVAKYNLFYNEIPKISWELIYNIIADQYNDFDVMNEEKGFLRDFNIALTDILPKYNKQWELAFDNDFQNITAKDLLKNGNINTNSNTRTLDNLNNQSDNPSEPITTPDKFNLEYITSQIQDKLSENITDEGSNLQVSQLTNMSKWVNTQIRITGLRKFTEEFGSLFNGFFNLEEYNSYDGDKIDTDDVYNTSSVQGITTTEALNYLLTHGSGGANNFAGLTNDTTVVGANGKDVINTLHTNIETIKTGELSNIETDGTVKDTVYNPTSNPDAFATQEMVKNNSSKEWDYDARGNKIINVAEPQNDNDAATKEYVDEQLRPSTGKQPIKDLFEIEADLTGTAPFSALTKKGTIVKYVATGTNIDTFTKDSIDYNTDAIKLKVYNIVSYGYSTTTSDNTVEVIFPIGEIGSDTDGGNKHFKTFSIKTKSATGNFFYAKQGFNVYRNSSNEIVLQTVAYATSESQGSHIKSMDIDYTQIKYKGNIGVVGAKGDKGDPGPGLSPTLTKKLEATDNNITIFGVDKADPTQGAFVKGDNREISLGVNNVSILTVLDNGVNKSTTIDSNLQLNSNKIGGVADGTAQTDAINLQQLNVEKAKIDTNTTNIAGNTTDIDLNNTEIGTNANNIDANKNTIGLNSSAIVGINTKLTNINPDGTVKDITFDPDTNPNQFATKLMVKDNAGASLPPELDKRINYGTNNRTILTTDKTDATAPNILLDNNNKKITTTISNTLVSEVFDNRMLLYKNLNMINHKIENVAIPTLDDDVATKEYVDSKKEWNYDAEGNKIINVANPTNPNDAVNKDYLDKYVGSESVGLLPRQTFESDDTLGSRDNVDQQITGWTEHDLDIKTFPMLKRAGGGNYFQVSQELKDLIDNSLDGVNIKFVIKTGGFVGVAQPQYLKIKTTRGSTTVAEKEFAAVWSTSSSDSYLGAINEIPYEVVVHFDKNTIFEENVTFYGKARDVSKANFQPPFKLSIEGEWLQGVKGPKGDTIYGTGEQSIKDIFEVEASKKQVNARLLNVGTTGNWNSWGVTTLDELTDFVVGANRYKTDNVVLKLYDFTLKNNVLNDRDIVNITIPIDKILNPELTSEFFFDFQIPGAKTGNQYQVPLRGNLIKQGSNIELKIIDSFSTSSNAGHWKSMKVDITLNKLKGVVGVQGETGPTGPQGTGLFDYNMQGNRLINLGEPILPTDGATKGYVDGLARNKFERITFTSPRTIEIPPNTNVSISSNITDWQDKMEITFSGTSPALLKSSMKTLLMNKDKWYELFTIISGNIISVRYNSTTNDFDFKSSSVTYRRTINLDPIIGRHI